MRYCRFFLISLFFSFVISLLLSCDNSDNATTTVHESPNVIVIFADDLGYGDLGCYGHPTIRTPHLDKMASEGVKFTQWYSGASVCTPSRAALLSGRLPIRFGMASSVHRVSWPHSASGFPESEFTIAEALKQKGYATTAVGKWHVGHKEGHLPTDHGFDEYFGIPYSNDMRPASNPNWSRSQIFPPLPLMEGKEVIEEEPDQRYLTRRYTERILSFIDKNKEQPFFVYYPQTFPHVPLYAHPDFEGTSPRGLYGDVVEEIDWSVGQIMNALKEHDLDEKTLVIFTSDNGPWLTQGVEGGSSGLLHQGKGCTYEGGMREPAIIRWPGKVVPGITTDALATTMDILPTVMSIVGVPLPDDRVYDGRDLSEVIFNDGESGREIVHFYVGSKLFATRLGDYKLHRTTLNPYIGEKPVTRDPPLLFNLAVDPGEEHNIAEDHPDIVTKIQKAMSDHENSVEKVEDQLAIIDEAFAEHYK